MVGIVDSATAVKAPAPAAEPRKAQPEHGLPAVAAGGKAVTPSGESLPPTPPPEPVVDAKRTVAHLNELMSSNRRSLRFQVAEDGGRTVITVLNPLTQEVIREIPPEEIQALARAFDELGSLVDTLA